MLTVLDAKNSTLANIAGVSTDSTDFLRLLNDATRRLLRRGDWPGTIVPIHVCVRNGCVVWPRFVEQVRAINACGKHVHVRGQWYDFLEYRQYHSCCGGSSCSSTSSTSCSTGCGPRAMTFVAHVPLHTDIYGDGYYIVAIRQANIDNGKTVQIFGVDGNTAPGARGNTLRTNNGDGTWSDGITLTLADDYAVSTVMVRRIDRVVKAVTQGQVYLFMSNTNNAATLSARTSLIPIASYDPGETSPDYMRYRLNIPQCCGTDNCGTEQSIVALVKLKYIEAKVDADWVLIDNLDALKDMMQSLKAKEAGDIAGSRQLEADAIRELNLQSADQLPDYQIPVNISPFARTAIGTQRTL